MPRKSKSSAIDARVSEALSGADKLKALLNNRFGTVADWSEGHGFRREQVYMTLSGHRPYPVIRDQMAADLEISRAEIDGLIGQTDTVAA